MKPLAAFLREWLGWPTTVVVGLLVVVLGVAGLIVLGCASFGVLVPAGAASQDVVSQRIVMATMVGGMLMAVTTMLAAWRLDLRFRPGGDRVCALVVLAGMVPLILLALASEAYLQTPLVERFVGVLLVLGAILIAVTRPQWLVLLLVLGPSSLVLMPFTRVFTGAGPWVGLLVAIVLLVVGWRIWRHGDRALFPHVQVAPWAARSPQASSWFGGGWTLPLAGRITGPWSLAWNLVAPACRLTLAVGAVTGALVGLWLTKLGDYEPAGSHLVFLCSFPALYGLGWHRPIEGKSVAQGMLYPIATATYGHALLAAVVIRVALMALTAVIAGGLVLAIWGGRGPALTWSHFLYMVLGFQLLGFMGIVRAWVAVAPKVPGWIPMLQVFLPQISVWMAIMTPRPTRWPYLASMVVLACVSVVIAWLSWRRWRQEDQAPLLRLTPTHPRAAALRG